MLLAKVEQTNDRLVIIPQRPVVRKTFAVAAWPFVALVCYLAYAHFIEHAAFVVLWPGFYAAFLVIVAVTVFVQRIIQDPSEPVFVFDRANRKILRDARFLGQFGNLIQVCLFKREMEDGRRLQLVLIMTDFGGWTIAETYVRVPESSLVSLGSSRSQPWEIYPRDRYPADATEYELVMLANRIHVYLGLREPAPCKYFIPLSSEAQNTMP